MNQYVVLANFTDQGIQAIRDTSKRAKAFRQVAESMGIKIKEIVWTLGEYDVVLTIEAKDDEAMAALALKVASLGNLRFQTMRAFGESEIDSIISKS